MFFKKKKNRNLLASKEFKIRRNSSVRYKNPLRIKKGLFKFKVFRVVNLILLIGIFACLYFFIFSSFYHINNIEIVGNQMISTDDLLDITNEYLVGKRLMILKNKNIFLFSKNGLAKKINETVILENIEINKILPNTIRVNLNEKEAVLKLITGSQEFLVGRHGQVIKRFYKLATPKIYQLIESQESIPTVDDDFIKIINLSNQSVGLGDNILNFDDVDFIFNLSKKFDEYDYLKIKDISIENNFPHFIIVNIMDGWKIYFNLAEAVEVQTGRLDVLIRDKINKANLNGLDYIDLRLGESIYYKMK
jgi:POTRA domain-containing FtsQ-type protein